jgi:quercetin dioxygenase-like cupin family protein
MSMAISEKEEIKVGQLTIQFLVEGKDSGGSVAIFELTVPPGARVPIAHSHDAYEETIYGLQGTVTFTLAGQPIDIGPGQALCIPRGVIHRFDNHSSAEAKSVAIISPGILGPDYFREIAAVVKATVAGPPDPAVIAAVMLRHGLTPAS